MSWKITTDAKGTKVKRKEVVKGDTTYIFFSASVNSQDFKTKEWHSIWMDLRFKKDANIDEIGDGAKIVIKDSISNVTYDSYRKSERLMLFVLDYEILDNGQITNSNTDITEFVDVDVEGDLPF